MSYSHTCCIVQPLWCFDSLEWCENASHVLGHCVLWEFYKIHFWLTRKIWVYVLISVGGWPARWLYGMSKTLMLWFPRHYDCDKCQTLRGCTTHWTLPIHIISVTLSYFKVTVKQFWLKLLCLYSIKPKLLCHSMFYYLDLDSRSQVCQKQKLQIEFLDCCPL